MRITKKKQRRVSGKRIDKSVLLYKDIDALNYHPFSYDNSQQWAYLLSNGEKIFLDIVGRTSPDDLCSNMFEPFIDANSMNEKAGAKQQYSDHLLTINHCRGIISGQQTKAKLMSDYIGSDIKEIVSELRDLNELKQFGILY